MRLMLAVLVLAGVADGFSVPRPPTKPPPPPSLALRVGQLALDWALESPLYKLVLVPQARATMVQTAEANGIEWDGALQWLKVNLSAYVRVSACLRAES